MSCRTFASVALGYIILTKSCMHAQEFQISLMASNAYAFWGMCRAAILEPTRGQIGVYRCTIVGVLLSADHQSEAAFLPLWWVGE